MVNHIFTCLWRGRNPGTIVILDDLWHSSYPRISRRLLNRGCKSCARYFLTTLMLLDKKQIAHEKSWSSTEILLSRCIAIDGFLWKWDGEGKSCSFRWEFCCFQSSGNRCSHISSRYIWQKNQYIQVLMPHTFGSHIMYFRSMYWLSFNQQSQLKQR